ncbi:hypothetical protein GCM10027594_35220 [Hymenobacter agri]
MIYGRRHKNTCICNEYACSETLGNAFATPANGVRPGGLLALDKSNNLLFNRTRRHEKKLLAVAAQEPARGAGGPPGRGLQACGTATPKLR